MLFLKYRFLFCLALFILCIVKSSFAQITIQVSKVPENTPYDATLYLVGNFNNWKTGDSLYRMSKQSDGTFLFTFSSSQDSLVYKIVRGNSWHTVEGRSNGRSRPNRITVNEGKTPVTVNISIASWEDLSGHSLSAYILILILAAIQGVILIGAINKLQNNNRKANRILSAILLLVSFALLGRVAVNYRDIFSETPSIYLVSDIVLFTYAPLFYAYLQELLTIQVRVKSKWLPFVPFILHTCIYSYLLLLPKQTFIDHMVDNDFMWIFASLGFLALCYNVWYWLKCLRVLRIYTKNVAQTHSFEQNLTYLNSVFMVQGLCLLAWIFAFLYSAAGWIFNYDYLPIAEYSVDAVWILFSGITYCLGYFAMNQPAIFKLSAVVGGLQTTAVPESVVSQLPQIDNIPQIVDNQYFTTEFLPQKSNEILEIQPLSTASITQNEVQKEDIIQQENENNLVEILFENSLDIQKEIPKDSIKDSLKFDENIFIEKEANYQVTIENFTNAAEKQLDIEPYKQQLSALMLKEKPHLEPQLTLPDLANQMHISLHLLSKVINDGYDKNFHDFINSYRIEEFKTLIVKPKYKNQTILAVALDAGFNSKTAFNRAFKKLTNSTPRDFLKQQSLDGMRDE
jgi:AraC-like DNA-binding protein